MRPLDNITRPVLEVLLNDRIVEFHTNESFGTADGVLGITMRLVNGALPNKVAIIFEGHL